MTWISIYGCTYETPPMNVRGSGAWPENSAPEKSNPGFLDKSKAKVNVQKRR